MSFELFLQSFSSGNASGIPLSAIRAAFGNALSELEEDFWQVAYGPEQSSDLFLAALPQDQELVHTISIYRPCTDARLYDALWQLLALRGTCLHFPGGAAPLTRDATLGAAMPAGMMESLGEAVVVDSAEEILRALGDDHS